MWKGCASPALQSAMNSSAHTPAPMPKLLAAYMPWFGNHTHMDVGYSSDDPVILHKQIQQARSLGIAGFVVDWYGESQPYSDHNFLLMQKAASQSHFQVALLYNEPQDEGSEATNAAFAAFDKAYSDYIGPAAKYRDAYLTYEGRPLIFIFPKQGHVDWNRVLEHCSNWTAPPSLIYEDQPPSQFANAFGGSFAWVQPGATGWSADGSNWGEQYLDNFYKTMAGKGPGKIAVGAAWPGFNDSSAKWGLNRHMQSGCGKTFDATLNLYQRYYDMANPLPFLLIETWNDYEEGTAIEQRNEAGCSADEKAKIAQSLRH
jgi:hypothetical protein